MDSFPNEILENVFLLLSHKNIAQVSLVCKSWYAITRQSIFYETLKIYNKQQWDRYIEMAKTITTTIMNINNSNNELPIGHLVKKLYIRDYYLKECESRFRDADIDLLSSTFPNIHFVDVFPYTLAFEGIRLLKHHPHWPYLTTFPHYVTDNDDQWYEFKKKSNTNDTATTTTTKRIISLEYGPQPKNIQFNNNNDNNNDNNNNNNPLAEKLILINANHYKSRRNLKDYPMMEQLVIRNNSEINNQVEIIDHEPYITYFGKTFLFSTKLESVFTYLKELTLNFGGYYHNNIETTTSSLELDKRTINNIHQQCPVLTTLELVLLQMNISDRFINNIDNNNNNNGLVNWKY